MSELVQHQKQFGHINILVFSGLLSSQQGIILRDFRLISPESDI